MTGMVLDVQAATAPAGPVETMGQGVPAETMAQGGQVAMTATGDTVGIMAPDAQVTITGTDRGRTMVRAEVIARPVLEHGQCAVTDI